MLRVGHVTNEVTKLNCVSNFLFLFFIFSPVLKPSHPKILVHIAGVFGLKRSMKYKVNIMCPSIDRLALDQICQHTCVLFYFTFHWPVSYIHRLDERNEESVSAVMNIGVITGTPNRIECIWKYSVSTDKVKLNCHFPDHGRNCMTHRQVLKAVNAKIIHTAVQLCLTSC
jgi:hypothetical protein